MQNKEKIYIGIDVSKKTLDLCLVSNDGTFSFKITNDVKSIKSFFKKQKLINETTELFIGMENTGFYNFHLYEFFDQNTFNIYIFNPLHLVKSIGMVRGKNDKIDAERIAVYVKRNIDILTPSAIPNSTFRKMKALFAKRRMFIEQVTAINVLNKEFAHCNSGKAIQANKSSEEKLLNQFAKVIKEIESELIKLIQEDEVLSVNYKRVTSVPGVGPILGIYLTIKTHGFTQLTDARKLACYAGVVPFPNQSGTSLNKRPKVSFMADKRMKSLLHLAALRVIQLEGEMKDYFIRKVSEGKNKMSVINAIRNKILARVCSCIKNEKMYEKSLDLS
jgi:transposase